MRLLPPDDWGQKAKRSSKNYCCVPACWVSGQWSKKQLTTDNSGLTQIADLNTTAGSKVGSAYM
ncbi:MAG TPA: hypothetical protein V6D48_01110 [Oculatellaceae cyanobacterium]